LKDEFSLGYIRW